MKSFLTFLLILLLAPLLGGMYGILHDQITYSIAPEYYTHFKFIQFGFTDAPGQVLASPRLGVSLVGFLATWWMGLFIGLVLGVVAWLVIQKPRQMLRVTLRAFLLTTAVALGTGLLGLAYGGLYLAHAGVRWNLPAQLTEPHRFIAVGSMHNFSYLGGLIGLFAGMIYLMIQNQKLRSAPGACETDQN